jgi:hypothetical protein
MMDRHASDALSVCDTKFVSLLSAARHANSSCLSFAAYLLSKVTVPFSLLIGKRSLCLSLVVVIVVHVSQSPLLFLAVVVMMILHFFSWYNFYVNFPYIIWMRNFDQKRPWSLAGNKSTTATISSLLLSLFPK